MLYKVLMLIAILFIIYLIFFRKSNKKTVTNKKRGRKPIPKGDIMIECKECATFANEDEAIIKDGKFYCSKKCAGVK